MKRLLLIALLVFHTSLIAQHYKDKDLKVGLVLSGGGAKGFAHIGALKVIEKAGVRIDYVGGTSMGAIVGALYASGYSPEEMDSIFKAVDFDVLIQDVLPRTSKTFYEKEDAERYAVTLPFNRFKVGLPSSISKGQNIYNLLARLLSPVSYINDFKDLPIPFFCIATDIETGEAVKLETGYLPEAIQASGAFPSLFQPVEIGGRVLIDGGVVNNYPIEEMKAKGVDVIIGIDVQDGLANRDDLNSAVSVLLQINNYRTVHAMESKAKETDVYIHPNITGYTVVSFDKGEEIIDEGEDAGLLKYNELKEIAIQQKYKRDRKPCIVDDTLKINNIYLYGNDRYSRAYIKGKLRFREQDEIHFEEISVGIGNLLATNNFTSARYKLVPLGDKKYDLNLYLKESKVKTSLRFGVHYDDLYKTSALLNITQKNLLQDDDVTSFDFIIGDNIRYNFEYYVDKGFYTSYGFKSKLNTFDVNVAADFLGESTVTDGVSLNRVNVNVLNWVNQLYFQTVFREEFSLGFGAEHSRYVIKTDNLGDTHDANTYYIDKSNYYSAFGYLKLDTYDNKYFPSSGLFFDGDIHLYLFSSNYTDTFEESTVARAKFGVATPLLKRLAFNLTFEGGITLGKSDLDVFDFNIGGYGNNFVNYMIPFYGYDFITVQGNSFIKSTATVDYEIFKKNHINFSYNVANVGDFIYKGEWLSIPDYSGYAVGYGLDTFLGPIEAKYSWSPEIRENTWFFSVGYWF